MDNMIKIIFFGTPDFVLPIPRALLDAPNIELAAVVTREDKPVGRKQILTPSPVKLWAHEHNIPILNLITSNSITNFSPDFAVLAAYGQIIPQEIIDLFPMGIIVLHPSLLPKYRGPSPIQAAIAKGDPETGMTIIKMDAKMDHGPIIAQFKDEIKPEDTPPNLYDRLFKKAAEVLIDILPNYLEDKIEMKEQDHSLANYTHILKKEHGFIPFEYLEAATEGKELDQDWPIPFIQNFSVHPSPTTIHNFIRALSPWPGAYTIVNIKRQNEKISSRLKIRKAHLSTTLRLHSGQVSNLVIDEVQLEGKNPVSWEQFQKAYPQVKLL